MMTGTDHGSGPVNRFGLVQRGVNMMTVYILGCQPSVVGDYLWPSGRPRYRALVISPEEPGNVGFYGWSAAVYEAGRLARRSGRPAREELVLLAAEAVHQAIHLAAEEDIGLPFKLPLKFRIFTAEEWQRIPSVFG